MTLCPLVSQESCLLGVFETREGWQTEPRHEKVRGLASDCICPLPNLSFLDGQVGPGKPVSLSHCELVVWCSLSDCHTGVLRG